MCKVHDLLSLHSWIAFLEINYEQPWCYTPEYEHSFLNKISLHMKHGLVLLAALFLGAVACCRARKWAQELCCCLWHFSDNTTVCRFQTLSISNPVSQFPTYLSSSWSIRVSQQLWKTDTLDVFYYFEVSYWTIVLLNRPRKYQRVANYQYLDGTSFLSVTGKIQHDYLVSVRQPWRCTPAPTFYLCTTWF